MTCNLCILLDDCYTATFMTSAISCDHYRSFLLAEGLVEALKEGAKNLQGGWDPPKE